MGLNVSQKVTLTALFYQLWWSTIWVLYTILTRLIWQWCENRNMCLFATYINTRHYKEADEESRRKTNTQNSKYLVRVL